MRNKKKHIALFFLIFFISIKAFSLHTFSHSDDGDYNECEICKYVTESNKASFIKSNSIQIKELVNHFYKEQFLNEYSYQFVQCSLKSTLFYRPPPVV